MATTRTNKVEVEIVASDEATPTIAKLEKRIDGLESDEARIIVTANTDRLTKQLDAAKRKMEGLEGDDLTVQARLVGALEEDLEEATKLFEKLDGQTGTVRLDASGNAADEVARFDKNVKSAGSSSSVLANTVGNTTQDIGQMGGIAGTAGVAIGQMGEYMADAAAGGEGLGSIMRNFGKVAVPIAAVTAAMWAFNKGAEQSKKRTEDLTDAIDDLTSATDANVLATWSQMFMRTALDGKNLHDQLRDLAEQNIVGARRLLDVSKAAGATTEQMKPLADVIAEVERAEAQEEASGKKFGESLANTASAADLVAASIDAARTNVERFGDDGVEQMGAVEEAADETAEAISGVERRYAELLGRMDRREAIRNAERAMDDFKTAAEEAYIAAASGADNAKEKQREYQDQVGELIDALIAAEADPHTIDLVLAAADQGDVNRALWLTQEAINRAPDLQVTVKIKPFRLPGGAWVDENGNVHAGTTSTTRSAPAIGSLTINMPRSANARDVQATMTRWAGLNA